MVAHTLNSNICDVYLSHDYPYRGSVTKLKSYTDHYQGSCRALVKGQTCSQSSSYNVIQIHHLPTVFRIIHGAQQIDISTERTSDCSFQCTLNVALWEIVVINKVKQLRYHEWRGVYHLTWKVIDASAGGFSLHVNATCNKVSCRTKLCDVVVSLSTMLKWKEIDRNHPRYFYPDNRKITYAGYGLRDIIDRHEISRTDIIGGIPLKLSPLVYWSWNDAHAYCRAKDLYLPTLTPDIMEQLKYTLNLQYLQHGWKHSIAYIFAGLHHHNLVSAMFLC